MSKQEAIPSTDEAWETEALGNDKNHVAKSEEPDLNSQIDKALEMQMISIRLQKSLIEDFKQIASLHGLGYQPLMRQILGRFAESEKKRLLNEAVCRQQEERQLEEEALSQRAS